EARQGLLRRGSSRDRPAREGVARGNGGGPALGGLRPGPRGPSREEDRCGEGAGVSAAQAGRDRGEGGPVPPAPRQLQGLRLSRPDEGGGAFRDPGGAGPRRRGEVRGLRGGQGTGRGETGRVRREIPRGEDEASRGDDRAWRDRGARRWPRGSPREPRGWTSAQGSGGRPGLRGDASPRPA